MVKLKKNASFTWRAVLTTWEVTLKSCKWEIGTETSSQQVMVEGVETLQEMVSMGIYAHTLVSP